MVIVLGGCAAPEPRVAAFVRLDQVGYAPAETKTAYLIAPRLPERVEAVVVDQGGQRIMKVAVGDSRGAWNEGFREVRPLDLTGLTAPGTYRVRTTGAVSAESPPFRIAGSQRLFRPLAQAAVGYFQNHRDGADQIFPRRPAHLSDREATVYESGFPLVASGGPVDLEGGWFDAGDYLKFTHTSAYALICLLVAQRDAGDLPGLAAETRHGLAWLAKTWDGEQLYTQVGVGSGDGFLGDHDVWRLPEDDDKLRVEPGDERYYLRHRPVFRTSGALSPNLAGRVAAAFALAAQVEAAADPALARRHLATAAEVYARASTEPGDLVTALPRSYYPESSWTDDLALAAVSLARAGALLHDPRAPGWLTAASDWVDTFEGTDGFSLYNVHALADAELAQALAARPGPFSAVDTATARRDLQGRLDTAVRAAAGNALGAAAGYGGSDYAARQLGQVAAAELYEHTFGDGRYGAFATAQRAVVLGANGWGTSLLVGFGTTYPRCPHDQISTLGRDLTAVRGAVVNGPNSADRVREVLDDAGPGTCGTRGFAVFDRDDAHYADDMRVSASNEPSIDFTATGLLAFTLVARQH